MNAHSVTFDKLVYLDRLKLAGVPDDVARAHADGLDQALRETVATKSDVDNLETSLGARIEKVETSLGARIEKVDARIDKVETSLGARIEKVEASLGARIEKVEASLGARIEKVETSTRAHIDLTAATLRREIEASKNSLLMWLIPFLLTGILPSLYTALKAAGILH